MGELRWNDHCAHGYTTTPVHDEEGWATDEARGCRECSAGRQPLTLPRYRAYRDEVRIWSDGYDWVAAGSLEGVLAVVDQLYGDGAGAESGPWRECAPGERLGPEDDSEAAWVIAERTLAPMLIASAT